MENFDATESAARQKALKVQRETEDFQWLMSDKRGRRLVYGWLKDARVFQTSYDPAAAHDITAVMAYNEGRKLHGYQLLERIRKQAPDSYARMMKENDDV